MEKYLVDRDVYQKYYRIVGELQMLERMAQASECMPGDKGTAALVETACVALNKAVTSAWEYAHQQTNAITLSGEAK